VKAKASVSAPRIVGPRVYEVDRSALIVVFVAGLAVGAFLASRHRNRKDDPG